MPISSGAHERASQTATGMPAPEQPQHAAASSARSKPPRPESYASEVGDCLPIPGAETEYVSRHAHGLNPRCPPMQRLGPLRQPRLGNSLRCDMSPFLPCPRMLREEDGPYLPKPFICEKYISNKLRAEIQILCSEVVSSREEESRFREEILELRTLISVLDAVVTRHAANIAPSGEEGVRCSRKKKTSPRGDVPNRRKTSHGPEYASTSGEEASDEDAGEMPTRAPLGRRVSGLREQTTRRHEFITLVSYRTYRRADTTRVVDSEDTGRVNV
jgi:hypothetical protein